MSDSETSSLISLLHALEALKFHLHKREEMLKLLDGSEPRLPAKFLLEFMFEIVLRNMSGQNGSSLILRISNNSVSGSSDAECQPTIVVKSDQKTETIQV